MLCILKKPARGLFPKNLNEKIWTLFQTLTSNVPHAESP